EEERGGAPVARCVATVAVAVEVARPRMAEALALDADLAALLRRRPRVARDDVVEDAGVAVGRAPVGVEAEPDAVALVAEDRVVEEQVVRGRLREDARPTVTPEARIKDDVVLDERFRGRVL